MNDTGGVMSQGILRLLKGGPRTVEDLSELMSIPKPHIRAAVTELLHQDRLITCDRHGLFSLGTPPDFFPKPKTLLAGHADGSAGLLILLLIAFVFVLSGFVTLVA